MDPAGHPGGPLHRSLCKHAISTLKRSCDALQTKMAEPEIDFNNPMTSDARGLNGQPIFDADENASRLSLRAKMDGGKLAAFELESGNRSPPPEKDATPSLVKGALASRHYASSAIENVNSMFTATFLKKADRLVMTDEDYKLVWFGLLHPTTPSRRIYNGLHSHCPRCHHSAASPPLNIHRHLYRKSERVSAA